MHRAGSGGRCGLCMDCDGVVMSKVYVIVGVLAGLLFAALVALSYVIGREMEGLE
jgi:hypothetical protein